MVNERPILSGVALPGNCRCCQKVIYPGNAYFVHTDASADESSRVYIVCSDCEKARNQQPEPMPEQARKEPAAGTRPGADAGTRNRTAGSGAGTRANTGTKEGKKVDKMQREKELQVMGEVAGLLNGTGYQMKHGKSGYLFVNSKGFANMNYICGDLETALKYAKEIKEKEGRNHGK